MGIRNLYQLGAGTITVTLGKNGTFVSNGSTQAIIPSITVNSIDPTGAGDAFIGAMLYQITNEEDPFFCD